VTPRLRRLRESGGAPATDEAIGNRA
jgi:hypothetical protein